MTRVRTSTPAGVGGPELPQGDDKRRAVRAMFDSIAPRYDAVNKAMSFGLDIAWRRRTAKLLDCPVGSRVLDLACGTGDFLRVLERSGRRSVGIDMSAGMLAHARTLGAPLVLGDAAALPFADGAFDGAVSGFALRNFADLDAVFGELARIVRPGGRIALLDVGEPRHRLVKAGHAIWFNHAVPLIGGLVSDRSAYRYLPRSVAYLPEPAELVSKLQGAGFEAVCHHPLSGGIVQVLTARRAA
jgi:demethylmenaquinone methyltransferase/2-methoxy-6-polyprenyl-1,4-benzoquinol methylase